MSALGRKRTFEGRCWFRLNKRHTGAVSTEATRSRMSNFTDGALRKRHRELSEQLLQPPRTGTGNWLLSSLSALEVLKMLRPKLTKVSARS